MKTYSWKRSQMQKANGRPCLMCCWHPHRLHLLRLLLYTPPPLPLSCFILLLHLLTSSSLLLHVAQCSHTGWGFRPCGNFLLIVAHGWICVLARTSHPCRFIRSLVGDKNVSQSVPALRIEEAFLVGGAAQTLHKEWETATFIDSSKDVEPTRWSSVKTKKKTLILWSSLIITAEDE